MPQQPRERYTWKGVAIVVLLVLLASLVLWVLNTASGSASGQAAEETAYPPS